MPHLLNYPRLLYWMSERENIRNKKETGLPKPWSTDPVFQTTYFCNVHREHDKVTRFIRQMYSPWVSDPLFESNIILARFLNWPDTLERLGYRKKWCAPCVKKGLRILEAEGKIWGAAYVVTTHGLKMDKVDYLCDRVMPSIEKFMPLTDQLTCAAVAEYLQNIEGISTFMAGQVVADLKNTPGHPLVNAEDWKTFALPGPGSRRGMNWLCGEKISDADWFPMLQELAYRVKIDGWAICNQDLQNCLCEYDKWERVTNGTGRSKRNYHGK